MSRIPAGILLSSDLFQQPWFIALGAFVAFNTILFVGLTVGKIFYWPKPSKSLHFAGGVPARSRNPLPDDVNLD
jgi:hypothetical protein